MPRVTMKCLREMIETLNKKKGKTQETEFRYDLYCAYDAYALELVRNSSGGSRRVFGLASAKEVSIFIDGMLYEE